MKSNNPLLKTFFKFIPGIIIGAFFALVIFNAMAWGPWAYNDSAAYVSAARNIAAGKGPVILHSTGKIKLLTEFPPFYPMFLSIWGGENGDYTAIIRTLNAFLFGATISLFFIIIETLSNRPLLSAISTVFFASFEFIIEIFTGAMSETLFFFLLFMACLAMLRYFQDKNKGIWFILLIVCSTLLPVTRYAGILFSGIIWAALLFFDRSSSIKAKITRISLFFLITFAPIGIWALTLLGRFNKFAGKSFIFHSDLFRSMAESTWNVFNVASQWVPYVEEYAGTWISQILKMGALIIWISIVVYPFIQYFRQWRSKTIKAKDIFYLSINVSLLGYLALIVFMHSTSYPPIDIINRTILPLYPLTLLSACMLIIEIIKKDQQQKALVTILFILSFILIRYNFLINRTYLNKLEDEGKGYTSRANQTSGFIEAIEKHGPDGIMISNLSGFVLYHTNEYPIYIENFPEYSFGAGNSYGESEFRQPGSILILITSEFNNFYGDSAASLYEKITDSLDFIYKDAIGEIYRFSALTQP